MLPSPPYEFRLTLLASFDKNHASHTATNSKLQRPTQNWIGDARLRYKMCDALTDCLVMLGYSECPTARRNKSGYRETKVDTVVLLMLG